jgi:hypothetical protein
MEGGFKPRPELFEQYFKRYEQFLQYSITQPGFRQSYGGSIPGGPWWFAVSKFASLEDMERFHLNPTHAEVQDEGRDKWWTAYYIRKGRLLEESESASGRILCETAILREQKFSPAESRRAEDALIALSEIGIMPCRELESMGTLVSKHYQIVPERKPRMLLRPDRLQREWMARE